MELPAPAWVAAPAIVRARPKVETSRQTPSPRPAVPGGMAAPIQEAVALHVTLGEARTRSARLVSALRGERRRSRLLSGAIAQLRQIWLQVFAA